VVEQRIAYRPEQQPSYTRTTQNTGYQSQYSRENYGEARRYSPLRKDGNSSFQQRDKMEETRDNRRDATNDDSKHVQFADRKDDQKKGDKK
jgi:hypothetical protein